MERPGNLGHKQQSLTVYPCAVQAKNLSRPNYHGRGPRPVQVRFGRNTISVVYRRCKLEIQEITSNPEQRPKPCSRRAPSTLGVHSWCVQQGRDPLSHGINRSWRACSMPESRIHDSFIPYSWVGADGHLLLRTVTWPLLNGLWPNLHGFDCSGHRPGS